MKAVKIYEQIDNRTVGIFECVDGTFTAIAYSQSEKFKTLKAADEWLSKHL